MAPGAQARIPPLMVPDHVQIYCSENSSCEPHATVRNHTGFHTYMHQRVPRRGTWVEGTRYSYCALVLYITQHHHCSLAMTFLAMRIESRSILTLRFASMFSPLSRFACLRFICLRDSLTTRFFFVVLVAGPATPHAQAHCSASWVDRQCHRGKFES